MSYILGNPNTFVLNTRFRLNKDESSAQPKFAVVMDEFNQFDRVCLLDLKIPHTYYQVLNRPKTFGTNTFQIHNITKATFTTIQIPEGNYTKHGISNVLESLIERNYMFGSTVTFPLDTCHTLDGKLTFSVNNPDNDEIEFIFDAFDSHYILLLLGFPSIDGTYPLTIANPAVLKSVQPIQTKHPRSLSLNSDIVGGQKDIYALAEIDVGVSQDFSDIVFQQQDVLGNSRQIANSNHKFFNFNITDENGEQIDLNGADWSMTILVYKINDESVFNLRELKLKNIEKINEIQKRIDQTVRAREDKLIEDERQALIDLDKLEKAEKKLAKK